MILALGVRNALSTVCVVAASFCRSLSELPTKTTQKGNAHKSANSQTHTYPDRTQHGTTHPDHAHVKHHHTQPKPNHTHTTHHTTTPPPNTQTQKPKKHKTGTRGNRGEAKERKEERRRKKEEEKGEGEKHKTGTRGNRTPDLLHPKKESCH